MTDYSEQLTPRSDTAHEHLLAPLEPVERNITATDEAPAATEERVVTTRPGLRAIIYEIVETIVLAVVIWLVVNLTTARYVVEGQSMEPSLYTGQFLIVNRLAYLEVGRVRLGSIQRGDIIVFDFPGNPGDDYVKRIIGLPGETVRIDESGRVFINGQLLEEPYLGSQASVPYRHRTGTWTVPQESYFVLGDNRNGSSDSRTWGMLPRGYIVGKALISYWPPWRWGLIPHYDYGTP